MALKNLKAHYKRLEAGPPLKTGNNVSKNGSPFILQFPIASMYGIFTYIYLIFMVNVGKYTIHGSYGFWHPGNFPDLVFYGPQRHTKNPNPIPWDSYGLLSYYTSKNGTLPETNIFAPENWWLEDSFPFGAFRPIFGPSC